MYAFGFSINNMTLLALTLAVGFVVDDAIVMLENIVRHIEGGMRPFEAALKGSREIGFTIVSITFSLIAVFIPVLLMGGMVGRVFREFAVTITVAIIVSGFVSLTLTPMLCARVLKSHGEGESQNIVLRTFEAMFELCCAATNNPGLRIEIPFCHASGHDWNPGRHRVAVHRHTERLFSDRGYRVHQRRHGRSVEYFIHAMTARTRQVADILLKDPAVDYLNITTGTGGANSTSNFGRALVVLKPRGQREDIGTVVKRLRVKANSFVGVAAYFQIIQNVNIGGRWKSAYQYTLQSSDTETLYKAGPEMLEKIAKIPGLRDVTSDLYSRIRK